MSGLTRCAEGYSTRPQPVACVVTNTTAADAALPTAEGTTRCQFETTDCNSFFLGYCDPFGDALLSSPVCRSGCRADDDCERGFVCACQQGPTPHGGECVRSDCTVDEDCDGGARCAYTLGLCGTPRFACQKAVDECVTDSDCNENGYGSCYFDGQKRSCSGNFTCGRPFLVEQQARVAPVALSASWCDHLAPRVDHLTAAQRAALAAHWTKLGQMEHASIAAFARFQLQLLTLGAPPELVQACNQALVDETAHTRLCFGLASAYAGQGVGPGPLDVQHSLDVTSLADIVDLVIVEGCFGETNAALEALEAADRATDPVIRSAYARIAEDEQRHAELAFRFVRWALTSGDESVRPRVRAAMAAPRIVSREALGVAQACLQALLNLTPSVDASLCQRA